MNALPALQVATFAKDVREPLANTLVLATAHSALGVPDFIVWAIWTVFVGIPQGAKFAWFTVRSMRAPPDAIGHARGRAKDRSVLENEQFIVCSNENCVVPVPAPFNKCAGCGKAPAEGESHPAEPPRACTAKSVASGTPQ